MIMRALNLDEDNAMNQEEEDNKIFVNSYSNLVAQAQSESASNHEKAKTKGVNEMEEGGEKIEMTQIGMSDEYHRYQ